MLDIPQIMTLGNLSLTEILNLYLISFWTFIKHNVENIQGDNLIWPENLNEILVFY